VKPGRSVHILLPLLIVTSNFNLHAQTKNYKIAGQVKDSLQKPIAYATVGLYKTVELQKLLKSTYANESGKFLFTTADTGSYSLIISYTGFVEQQKNIRVIDKDVTTIDIQLLKSNRTLAAVTVVSKKSLIEQFEDKIIFNVENDPMSKTEMAIDILRKTPFVSVDGDDNVQLNGQSNFKVLLNGRETAMFAQNVKEALKGFPGALITKIEVITSPSAKYDGEGMGGIINIITQKKIIGYHGSMSVNVNTTSFHNINGNFSAKSGKLGFTLFYGTNGVSNQPGKIFTQTIPNIPGLFTKRTLQGDRHASNAANNGNLELNYEIDSLNTVSAYCNISGGYTKTNFDQTITTEFPSSPVSVSYYDLDSKNEFPTFNIGTDYIKKFKSNKEKEFSIQLNSEFGKANSFLRSSQDNAASDRFIINNSITSNKQYTLESDYIMPLGKNRKLEAGVKAIVRGASSDFESFMRYDPQDPYKLNPSNTDNFSYDQQVYSVYSSYGFKIKKTSFRLGARLENTVVNGNFEFSATKVKQNYMTLLPNVQATTRLSNTFTMVLTYGKRLQRPFIWNLNPFLNNNDSMNISYGNPELKPATVHSITSQIRYNHNGLFAGLTLEGSYSGNKIMPYSSYDAPTGVTKTTSLNLGKEYQFSASGNISARINPDWNIFVNGTARYNNVSNKLKSGQVNKGISGNVNLNTTYKLNKKCNATANAGFYRNPVTIQTRSPFNLWYGAGVAYKLFNEKLTATINAIGFFQKYRDNKSVTTDPYFTTSSVTTVHSRGVSLNLTWSFGKLKENVSKRKGNINEDLIGSPVN
jgi:outer membrane receptor for ferrienterochelin and colicin